MPAMRIMHGTHWNASGKRQEKEFVTGTFEEPYPTQVEMINPTPIICWVTPVIRPIQFSFGQLSIFLLVRTSCLRMSAFRLVNGH